MKKQKSRREECATAECNYNKIDRQLKEQFIHGLNDDDMMIEIMRKHIRNQENENVTSEQILV